MKFWHQNEDDGAKFSVKYDTIRPELSGAWGPAAKYDGMREPHMFNFLIFIIGAALMFGMGVRSVLARRRLQTKGEKVTARVAGTAQGCHRVPLVCERQVERRIISGLGHIARLEQLPLLQVDLPQR